MSRIAIGLFAFLASASVASAQAQVMSSVSEPAIVTHGQASVKRAPDRAWLTVSTEVREAKSGDARKKGADVMTAVQNALKATGLPADAIRTTAFSLTPEMLWTGGTAQVKGYVVHNEIEVRVDDLDKLSQVIDAANSPKNAALSVTGPRFDLKNREGAEQDVLRLAVENALARAQAIATGARRNLGQIIRIDEQNTGTDMPSPRPMLRATAAGRAGGPAQAETQTPITPGAIEIHAEVTVTVGIR
jgi:uncharacterized protein YggE